MSNDKRNWSYEEHRKHSPQFDKGQEHQDKQYGDSIKIAVVCFIIGALISFLVTKYYYIESSYDLQTKYDNITEQNGFLRHEIERGYNISKLILEEVESQVIDNKTVELSKYNLSEPQLKVLAEYFLSISRSKYDDALAHYVLSNYTIALKEINDSLILEPDNVKFLTLKGEILYYMERYNESYHTFLEAINLTPEDDSLWLWAGFSCNGLNCPRRAEDARFYEKALELNPKNVLASYHLANYYCYSDITSMAFGEKLLNITLNKGVLPNCLYGLNLIDMALEHGDFSKVYDNKVKSLLWNQKARCYGTIRVYTSLNVESQEIDAYMKSISFDPTNCDSIYLFCSWYPKEDDRCKHINSKDYFNVGEKEQTSMMCNWNDLRQNPRY